MWISQNGQNALNKFVLQAVDIVKTSESSGNYISTVSVQSQIKHIHNKI